MQLRNALAKINADALYEGKFPRIAGQITGASPPIPALNGVTYICTTSGGSFIVNTLYRSNGSSWVALPLVAGAIMVTLASFTGGTVSFQADTIYVWDAEGLAWVGPSTSSISFDSILTDDVTGQVIVDDVTGNVMVAL